MIHTRAKNWRNFDPVLMQITASILSSYRMKMIQKSTTIERITSPKVVAKNRLKAANLRPEKPFAH